MEKRKHVRDLAPFASSEDLSDDRESPLDEDKQKPKLSNIEEEMKTPSKTAGNLNVTNVAPRIDISRASSSSHQEDSSPEKELFSGNGKSAKLEVAFGEEMASDLHSSTEELSFQETEDAEKHKRKKSSQIFPDLQIETLRKDSGCSDIALLSISGRTSRVSSVGSVASGGSGVSSYSAVSHCSAASHLSAVSNISRGSSPHRMSLETSFCGPKPMHTASLDVDDTAKSIISDKLLQKTEVASSSTKDSVDKKEAPKTRKHLSSQSAVHSTREHKHSKEHSKHKRKKPSLENPKTQKFVSLHSDEEEEPIASRSVNTVSTTSTKIEPTIDNRTQIYIPLHGTADENIKCEPNPNSPKRLKPFTNTTLVNFIRKFDVDDKTVRSTRRAKSATEADYRGKQEINEEFQTFISLKDDDDCDNADEGSRRKRLLKHRRSVSTANTDMKTENKAEVETHITIPIQVHQSRSPEPVQEPVQPKQDLPRYLMTTDGTTQYIPLRGSDTELQIKPEAKSTNQNNYLSVSKLDHKSCSDDHNLATSASPNLGRQCMPSSLELAYERPTRSTKSMTQLINIDHSRTPSPNASINKNYNSNSGGNSHQNYLFRRCSESAKEIRNLDKPKSRSGSIKSLFSTFFKRSGSAKHKKNSKPDVLETQRTVSSEHFIKQQPKKTEPDTIIIPLHSPDEVPPRDLSSSNKAQEDISITDVPINNKNNTNITDGKNMMIPPPPIFLKMEYSEVNAKAQPEMARKQELDVNVSDVGSKQLHECSEPVHNKSPSPSRNKRKLERHEVQCEVTVHTDAVSPTQTQLENKKSNKNDTIQQSDTTQVLQQTTEDQNTIDIPTQNMADIPSERNSLTENQMDSIPLLRKESHDEEGGDISTDSDRGTLVVLENEDEHKKLVNQEESFEELPYVPTTLPLERSVAVPIVPIKERVTEVRTFSVDRPRSVTPLNPSSLETYVTSLPSTTVCADETSSTEKLHITLPRTDAPTDSPRKRHSLTRNKSGSSICGQRNRSISVPSNENSSPPPLPPRKSSASWISFEDSGYETRQSPKRITTLPSSYGSDVNHPDDYTDVKFSQKIIFVNPDECSCDCHESQNPAKNSLQ